ncbi:MAG TPA: hypothetical protein VMC06_06290 [Opitutaceae bacterium]|nr:hypothetical protein [Opitutaceae bacterium]
MLGIDLYEGRVIARQNAELQALRESSRRQRDESARQLAAALQQLADARTTASHNLASLDPVAEHTLNDWLGKVARLKQCLEQMPNEKIPELKLLQAKDWLDAANFDLGSGNMGVRQALSKLRRSAKERMEGPLSTALQSYLKANRNQPPGDAIQLAPYFEPPVDPAILQRYGPPSAEQSQHMPQLPDGERLILCEKATVDDYFDTTMFIGSGGYSCIAETSKFQEEVQAAIENYRAANNGRFPTDPSQLATYLHSSIDPNFVRMRLDWKPVSPE